MRPDLEIYNLIKDISLYGLEKIGIYLSKYRAFVADNNDLQSYNRLKVSVPDIYGDQVLDYWAWPSSNYSGQGYGFRLLPNIDDLVWVEFERGNPRRPVWSYGHFGKDEVPSDLKDNSLIWFRTPGGITITIDDANQTLKFSKKDNDLLALIDYKNGDLKINHSNKLTLDFDGSSELLKVFKNQANLEPATLGNKTVEKLDTLCQDLLQLQVDTNTGLPLPTFITAITQLKATLNEIKATNIKIT